MKKDEAEGAVDVDGMMGATLKPGQLAGETGDAEDDGDHVMSDVVNKKTTAHAGKAKSVRISVTPDDDENERAKTLITVADAGVPVRIHIRTSTCTKIWHSTRLMHRIRSSRSGLGVGAVQLFCLTAASISRTPAQVRKFRI